MTSEESAIDICEKIHLTISLHLQVVYDMVSNDIHLIF